MADHKTSVIRACIESIETYILPIAAWSKVRGNPNKPSIYAELDQLSLWKA